MIGYYVHHHGHGHLHRAISLTGALDEPVVGLSSLPRPAGVDFADWLDLAPDDPLEHPDDPRAGGALHWAPLNSAGYGRRMQQLASWIAQARPRLVVVDLSVEVSALVRLLGVPTVVVTLPGDRSDDAHRLAYRLAAAVIAPWPRPVYDPPHLHPYADKIVFTGAISRFDHEPVHPAPGDRQALLLLGSGGSDAAVSGPDPAGTWRWTTLGGRSGPWSDDVWTAVQSADVVVTHAGLNALAEVAAARRPAVVLPQDRPFGEQRATAAALQTAGLATVLPGWPHPHEWPQLLETAAARGESWARWNDGQGAARFAAALARVGTPAVDGPLNR